MDLKNISFRFTCMKNGIMVLERGPLKIDSNDQKMIRLLRINDHKQTHRAVVMYFHAEKSDVLSESSEMKGFSVSLRRNDQATFVVTATYGQDNTHVVLCETVHYPLRYKKAPRTSKKDTVITPNEIEIAAEHIEYNTAKRVAAEPFLGGLNLMLEWGRSLTAKQNLPTPRHSDIEDEPVPKKVDLPITIIIAKCYINTEKLDQILSSAEGFHTESPEGRIQNVKEVALGSLCLNDPCVPNIFDITSFMSQDTPKHPQKKRHQHENESLEKRRKSC